MEVNQYRFYDEDHVYLMLLRSLLFYIHLKNQTSSNI